MSMDFVNPYNFVPLPHKVKRRNPWGHCGPAGSADEQLYSGVLKVQWKLITPLQLIPEQGWVQDPDGRVRIPGSSIKGVVRSLHETMFNGCLRVFDDEFLPGYRMPAVADHTDAGDWRLAQVTRAEDGSPREFRPTTDVHWVLGKVLRDRVGRPVATGDLLTMEGYAHKKADRSIWTVTSARIRTGHGQVQQRLRSDPEPHGTEDRDWVCIVTSLGARGKKPPHWACGRLGTRRIILNPQDEADREVLTRFAAACEGTDDRRKALQKPHDDRWRTQTQYEPVEFDRREIAKRALQTGLLFPGDVVWVKVQADRITDIRLSQIWRKAGQGRAGLRVPEEVLPCQDAHSLCLSCATFGSAESERHDGELSASNQGYASHVRFSAAISQGTPVLTNVGRAPLMNPRPGAGMFYLRRPENLPQAEQGDLPGQWGSESDDTSQLRGRKFYWHSDPYRQQQRWGAPAPRYQAVGEQPVTEVTLVEPGTVFEAEIAFDRLPHYAVTALVMAIDPARALDVVPGGPRQIAIHLGGGKPLGLGTAQPSLVSSRIWSLTGRYLGQSPQEFSGSLRDDMAGLRGWIDRLSALGPLAKLLDVKGLGEDETIVAYPSSADWNTMATPDFVRSYEFFQQHNGLQCGGGRRKPWRPLPAVAENEQRIRQEGQNR